MSLLFWVQAVDNIAWPGPYGVSGVYAYGCVKHTQATQDHRIALQLGVLRHVRMCVKTAQNAQLKSASTG